MILEDSALITVKIALAMNFTLMTVILSGILLSPLCVADDWTIHAQAPQLINIMMTSRRTIPAPIVYLQAVKINCLSLQHYL